MAATIVGASGGGSESGSTANVPRTSGLANGDLVVALTFRDDSANATVTPNGGAFDVIDIRETAASLRGAAWQTIAASEPTQWGWTCSTGTSWEVTAVAVRVFFSEGSTGSPTTPVVTAAQYEGDDPLVLYGWATVDDGNYDGITWSNLPAALTQRFSTGKYGDGFGGGYLGTLVASEQKSGHPDIAARTVTADEPFPWVAIAVVIPTTVAAAVDPPTVDAGVDATVAAGDTFTRTATETGDDITARGWTIQDGPVGVGATIGTAAALSWVPGASLPGSNDPRQPTFEEIAYEITSTAENSRTDWYSTDVYGYIEDIHDERGYTAGIVGFCSGTGDMLEMVEHYVDLNPSTAMAAYVDELTTLAAEGQGPNAGTRADALLGSTFRNLWASLAVSDPLFRQAQRDYRDENYWEPALAQALADGVGPLGVAILYDISINHGHADLGSDDYDQSFEGIVATAQADADPPSDGGNEAAYLNALVDAREAVLLDWGEDQADLDEGRVGAHRALISSGNLTLTAPISWTMYTDPFELATRPDPIDDVIIGTYTLRYSATNAGGTDTDDMVLTVGAGADEFTGTGSTGLAVDAAGTGTATRASTGSAAVEVAATAGPGEVTRTGVGEQPLTLDATGTGSTTRTGGGTAGVDVTAAGTGSATRTSTGDAGLTVAATGTGTGTRAGTGSVGVDVTATAGPGTVTRRGGAEQPLALAAGGSGTTSRGGTGAAGLTVAAGGTGAATRTITGNTGLDVDAAGHGVKTAAGSGSSAASLTTAGTGERAVDGAAVVTAALSASTAGGRKVATGTGQVALTLTATGVGDLTMPGHAEFLVAATANPGSRTADGDGEQQLTLDTTGGGPATRVGTGTAAFRMGATGAGGDVHTGRGHAAFRVGASGTGTRFSSGAATSTVALDVDTAGERVATGRGEVGLVLDAAGANTERAGTGHADLTVDAAGTGRRVATGRGRVTLAVGQGTTGHADRAGTATARVELVESAGGGVRGGRGAAQVGLVLDVHTVGTRAAAGRGDAGLVLGQAAAGVRVGHGAGRVALRLAGDVAGHGHTAPGEGSARLVLDASGTAHPIVHGHGTARLVLRARPRRRVTGRFVSTVTQSRLEASA